MKIIKIVVFICFQTFITVGQSKIQINIPSVEMETDYIWRNIQDTKFFEQHNYQVSYPQDTLIVELLEKSRNNQLQQSDYNNLLQVMKKNIYNEGDYQNGYQKIKDKKALMNQLVLENEKMKRKWEFRKFPVYQINLTLYGPGGSYNNENGSILIYTTKEGAFKRYDDPSNTIIHEIIHIGIEASIIQKYGIIHPDKERIVDRYVKILFGDQLPDYQLQNMGNKKLDSYLKTKKDICRLEKRLKTFLEEK